MKLFLDTCVLVDYFSRRSPHFDSCMQLRIMQLSDDAELWVSAKSFTDIFCILRKVVEPASIQRAFTESLSFLNICSVGGKDIQEAARLSWRDFEDCLISICAEKVKADYILTRDEKDFTLAKTTVLSPENFLEKISLEHGLCYEEIAL